MTKPMPDFPEFYREIHHREPFPWQRRLAALVARTGQWPNEIGVPTGMGKTACLDIAVWWLASQADLAPVDRTAPTRIWWVVNRRLLVDSTAKQAEELAALLSKSETTNSAQSDNPAVAAVAARLRKISADPNASSPLEVISLRGGISSRTPTDPSHPAVILCTLPMYGSRLLFRGYGSSLRSVDAAMSGTDSLVLLDEAHLAPHLRSLLNAAEECMPGVEPIFGNQRSRATLVALTATGDTDQDCRFDLEDSDLRHAEVKKRLDASKPTEVRIAKSRDGAKHLCAAALDLLQQALTPASHLLFANTPKTARQVHGELVKRIAERGFESDVLLLTGLMREREARMVRERVLDPAEGMAAAGKIEGRQRHLIVIATQTLEVGADIDAEYLVTEACGVRALTQRLGRLNRLGRFPHARAIYVHTPSTGTGTLKSVDFWPVYGSEPAEVLKRLNQAKKDDNGLIDLSPRQIARTLGIPGDNPGRAPELLPGILWEWIKTTTPPEGEAPVEPFFAGIANPRRAVTVFWRSHLPANGERLWPRATELEAVDVPIGELRQALSEQTVHRIHNDSETLEELPVSRIRPGDRVALSTDRGLLDRHGWNPVAAETVVDVSLAKHGLPLDAVAIKRLCGIELAVPIRRILGSDADESQEVDEDEREKAIEEILAAIRGVDTPAEWAATEWEEFTAALQPRLVTASREVPRLAVEKPEAERLVADLDETSLVGEEFPGDLATLDGHGNAVGARARLVAERIGLLAQLAEVIELAGDLHDIGKADGRFQQWLDPERKSNVAMAKSGTPRHRWSATRAAAGWPRGGRHEALSARLTNKWLEANSDWGTQEERDLLLHLIVSHHGKGRPMVLPVRDSSQESVRTRLSGMNIEVPANLAEVDWTQPARFRRLNKNFGPWGLALLEAIVIRSDHAVSAITGEQ